ncbi:RNA polymerase subunit sigma [Streptomyces sp. NPDC056452]|uniref:RNA polymerase subunit sigma n=1 Tax=Streptomyces sp. NPDC056452 TaxID=3345821 RepID=UPI0036C6CD44
MDDAGDSESIAELLDERRHLLDVACWMLGSGPEAESVIAEAYRRWYGLSDPARARIAAPRSWLTKVVGNICSARLILPDQQQIPAAEEDDGEAEELHQPLEDEAGTVLLNAPDPLSPAERGAFLLDDVCGMTPGASVGIGGRPEQERTELAHRARRSLRAQRSRPTTPQEHDTVVRAVRQACVTEDAPLLASLLASDATAHFDGGGKVRALTTPVHGNLQVARSLLTLLARCPRTTLAPHSVNGRTGIVVRYGHQVAAIISLDIAGRHAVQVWVTLNPDKLRSWNQPIAVPGPSKAEGNGSGAQEE